MRSYPTARSGAHLRRQPENQICRYHTEASTTSPESYVACLYRPSGVLTGFGFVFERHTSGLLLAHAPETVFTHSPISFSFHYTSDTSHFSSPVCSEHWRSCCLLGNYLLRCIVLSICAERNPLLQAVSLPRRQE